ncbi:MAG: hypothetical protein GNW80_06040 [Asgard group archaeon]|nr:hypothetical protein [Asgard group archaeon]
MNFFKRIFTKRKKGIGQEIKKPATIERMAAPETIKEGETLRIVVSGHFSNLGWSLDEAEANTKKNDVTVTVIGKKKTGVMSAQALKPYKTTVEIKKLKKGRYKIKAAKGPAGTLELEVK